MKHSIILLFLFVASATYSQNIIDTNNKVFLKEMKKAIPDGKFQLLKIDIPWYTSTKGEFYTIHAPSKNDKVKYAYFGRAVTIRGNGGNKVENAAEYFDFFVLYDAQKTVKTVRIYRYKASYGEGITSPGWLKQFVGYDGKKALEVGKNIDAISGATISTYVMANEIETQTGSLQKLSE